MFIISEVKIWLKGKCLQMNDMLSGQCSGFCHVTGDNVFRGGDFKACKRNVNIQDNVLIFETIMLKRNQICT